MSSVDNRVVKMSFDNAEFERNAGTTLGTLDKLKQSLNFSGSTKGLEDIQSKANGISFEALANGIEAIQARFGVLGEFVHNTFLGIVQNVSNAATQLASAVTIEPMKEGFAEYELQMNSVQTIMASTGADIGTVGKYLDELNAYADKTIYSFSDMTSNIGKFTNAGVSLDSAVAAIQGVSNVAAVSGANTNEASRAMYNFAQALSSGAVKLIDWKSIENANMATVEFKQALLDSALAMGTVVKEGDKYVSTTTDANGKVSQAFDAVSMFNDSLSSQWMTTDVLVQTLQNYSTDVREMTAAEEEEYRAKLKTLNYTDEQIESIIELGKKAADSAKDVKTFSQLIDTLKEALGSGWTKSFEYIFGDLEQAKALWTGISNVLGDYINKSAEARNDLLRGWSQGGGRTAIIDGLTNAFNALLSVIEPVKQAIEEVFPAITVERLIEYSNKLKTFTETLKLNEEGQKRVHDIAKKIFEMVQTGFEGIQNLGGTVLDILKSVGEGISNAVKPEDILHVSDLVDRFKQFTEAIKPNEAVLTNISKLVTGVVSVLRALASIAIDAGSALFDSLGGLFNKLSPDAESFIDLMGRFGDWLTEFAGKIEVIFNFEAFSGGFNSIADAAGKAWDAIKQFLHLDSIVEAIKNFFTIPKDNEHNFDILEVVHTVFTKIKDVVGSIIDRFKDSNIDITKVLGVGAGGVLLKKVYDILNSILDSAKDLGSWKKHLLEIKDAICDTFGAIQENIKADVLKKIAIAIGILVASLWVLSGIDTGQLVISIAAIGGLMGELKLMMDSLSNMTLVDAGALKTISTSLIKIAAAVLILAEATAKLSEIPTEDLAKGLISVTVLLGEMVLVAKEFSKFEKSIASGATGLILLAAAVLILSKAVKDLGSLDYETLAKGLGSTTILIGELVIASKHLEDVKFSSGAAFVLMAESIKILASAVEKLGGINFVDLVKGLGSVGVLLAEVTIAANNLPKDMVKKAAGMFIVAEAVKVMAGAVVTLGSLDLGSLVQGLAGTAVALGELVIAAKFMEGSLAGAAAMLVMAAALIPMATAIGMIGSMPLEVVGQGLIVIAGALTIFGVAGAILTPLAPGLLAVSAAFAVFGVAILAVGTGIGIAAAAVSVGGVALIEFIRELVLLIPELGVQLGEMFVNYMATISENIPVIIDSLSAILQAILTAIGENVPLIVDTFLGTLATLFQQLADYVPRMADAALKLLGGFLSAIAENIQQIVEAGISILVNFMKGVAEKLPEVIDAAFKVIISFINGLADAIRENHNALFDAVGNLIKAICEAIIDGVSKIVTAGGELIGGLLNSIGEFFDDMDKSGENLVVNLIKGIADFLGKVIEVGGKIILSLLKGIGDFIGKVIDNGGDIIKKFLEGIGNFLGDVVTKGGELVGKLIEGIQGFFTNIFNLGGELVGKLHEGIDSLWNDIWDAGSNLVSGFIDGLTSGLGDVWNAACDLATQAWNAITGTLDEHSPSRLTYQGGVNFVQGFVNGIEDSTADPVSSAGQVASDALTSLIYNFADTANQSYNAGLNFIMGFGDGLADETSLGLVGESAEGMATSALDALRFALGIHSPSDVTYGDGANFVQGFAEGINDLDANTQVMNNVLGVSANALQYMRDTLGIHSPSDETYYNGANFVYGFAEGIMDPDANNQVSNSVENVSSGALQYMEDILRIHSPSEETYEEGANFTEGFAEGINDPTAMNHVSEAIQNLIQRTLAEYSSGMSHYSSQEQMNYDVNSMAEAVSSGAVDSDIVQYAMDVFSRSRDSYYQEHAGELATTFANSLASQNYDLNAVRTVLDNFDNLTSDIISQYGRISEEGIYIAPDTYQIERAMSSVIDEARAYARTLANYSTSPFATGLSLGISATEENAVEKTREACNNIIAAMERELGINSPSKITEEIGRYFVQGFVNGISDTSVIQNQASYIASDSINSLNYGLGDNTYISGTMFSQGFANGIADPYMSMNVQQAVEGVGSNSLLAMQNILGIHSPSEETYTSGVYFVQGFAEGIQDLGANNQVADSVAGVSTDALQYFQDILGIHSPSEKTYDNGANFTEGFAEGINDPTANAHVSQAVSDLVARAFEAFNNSIAAKDGMLDGYSIDAMTQNFAESLADGNYDPALVEAALNEFDTSTINDRLAHGGFTDEGDYQTPEQVRNSSIINQIIGEAQNYARTLPNYATSFFHGGNYAWADFKNWGVDWDSDDVVLQVQKACQDIIATMERELGIRSPSKKTEQIGEYLIEGFVNGISDTSAVQRQLTSFASETLDTLNDGFGINSPSKETESTGKYFITGFIKGIDEASKEAINSSGGIAYGIISAFEDGIEDGVSAPTITPVIDSSYIQNGISSVNGMIQTIPQTYDINAHIENEMKFRNNLLDILRERDAVITERVTQEIAELRADMGQYAAMISNTKVVLDSGAMVGEMAPLLDNALGMRQSMSYRGVYR